jgi:imidazolonepropionase-like amidohydrolase
LKKKYREAGARYLAGSAASAFGTMPGVSLHTELELLNAVGLTPRETLAAATSNFETVYGWRGKGQIKPGYEADVLVLDENPLDDIRSAKKISLVISKGEVIDREKLLQ